MDEERTGGFLPPQAAGPEPELDGPPQAQSPPSSGPQAPGPPAGAQPTQPYPTQPYAPGTQPTPPPQAGWQQQPPPGWQQPPTGWYQQPPAGPWQPQPWARPAEPDNGPAVAGFVLSMVAGGLLLFSGGLSSIVSIACAAFGILYSRKGRRKIDAGETTRHRGLAQAGFIGGIIALGLSVIATLAWLLILILALTDDEFQNDIEREFNDSNSISAALRLGLAAGRLAGRLLT